MKEIFLTSSVLILMIVLLRYVLRGKMAPRLQYALWLLAAVRLLVPGTLFTVPVSVAETVRELPDIVQAANGGAPSIPADGGDGDLVMPISPAGSPAETGRTPAGPASPLPQSTGGIRLPAGWTSVVWKAGIAVTGGTMLLSNLHFAFYLRKHRRRLSLPPGTETGNLPVYMVDDLSSPCLFGLLSPAIYLNRQALDPAHLTYVLAHERTHYRHGDHIWSILRCVCLAVHWYNPLVWLAASLSRRDCELACDDGVIWLLGEGRRLDYGTALLRMVSTGRPLLLRASTSMTAGKRNLKERIMLITQRPRMLRITLAAVVLVMCGTVAVTFGGAEDAGGSGPLEDVNTAHAENPALPPEEISRSAPIASGHLTSVNYTHFSGLFALTLPDNWLEDVVYIESEDGVTFYETEDNCWLMTVVPQPAEWADVYDQAGIRLAEFAFNGDPELAASGVYPSGVFGSSPYIYMLDWNQKPEYTAESREHILSLIGQRDAVAGSFQLLANADTFSRLVHDAYQANMPLAIAYLPYLSWENYRSVYSEDEMFSLLEAVWAFARSGAATWGQYHDMMSNRTDRAIDGAYAESYADIIWELYQQNAENFTSVLESQFLTDGERDHVIFWFRNGLVLTDVRPDAYELTKEEIFQILGIA